MRVKGREGDWNRKAFDCRRKEERIGADIDRLFSCGAERERKAKIEAGRSGVDIGRNFLNT